jgi:nudix-type nucleoside diphosphatase (YffH/AdpP family)
MAEAGSLSAPIETEATPVPFRIMGQRTVYKGFTRLDLIDLEQTGSNGVVMRLTREIESHGDGAAVLAFDSRRRVAVLVRQLRVPVALVSPGQAYVLEVVAGLIDHAGDGAADTARREAIEEAGLRIAHLVEITSSFTTPGISTERLSLFLAEVDLDVARVAAGGGLAAEHEDIEVVEIPLSELARMADAGEILDLKSFALVQTLRLKRPELFV